VNDLVVCQHPVYGKMIKRIKQKNQRGDMLLTGENAQSLSSQQMGWITAGMITGKVLLKIR
jgi:hypothetical protein